MRIGEPLSGPVRRRKIVSLRWVSIAGVIVLIGTLGHAAYSQRRLQSMILQSEPLNIIHAADAQTLRQSALDKIEHTQDEAFICLTLNEINALLVAFSSQHKNTVIGCRMESEGNHLKIFLSLKDPQSGKYINLVGAGIVSVSDGILSLQLRDGRIGKLEFRDRHFRSVQKGIEAILNERAKDFLSVIKSAKYEEGVFRAVLEKNENKHVKSVDKSFLR